MNTIRIEVQQAPSYSSNEVWRAVAIINEMRTTVVCQHGHGSQALATKCANGAFAKQMTPYADAELVSLDNGTYEARWTDLHGRAVTRLFRFVGGFSSNA
jgi:hypothetical protein